MWVFLGLLRLASSSSSAQHCSRDQALLQVSSKASAASTAASLPGEPGVGVVDRSFLGKGYDIMETDLWTFENVYPTELYVLDMPQTCFRERMCPRAETVETNFHDSVEEFSRSFFSSFGLDFSGRFLGIKGALSVSMQKSMSQSGSKAQSILEMRMYKRGGCYQLRGECAYDAQYLNPEALSLMQGLPLGSDDASAMQLWEDRFIRRFGTHASLGSEHGAQVRATASSSSSAEGMEWYLKNVVSGEIAVEWGQAGIGLGFNSSEEEDVARRTEEASYSTRCSTIGGDPAALSPCISQRTTQSEAEMVEARLRDFWTPQDLTTGHSVFSLYLQEVTKILSQMGYYDYSHAVKKAVEYHMCKTPTFKWAPEGSEHVCTCNLECKNGGTLDVDSCACQCPGDNYHGWTGADCSEPWGMCQMGANSAYEDQARKCPVDNTCATPLWSAVCHSTEVCCLTPIAGTCCPFGYSCDCDADSCECVAPAMSPTVNSSSAEM
jgi:hypothetical protein